MEEKASRIENIKSEIKNAAYDAKIQEVTTKIRGLEEQREDLNQQLKNLSLQADARAKLDLLREDQRKKAQDLKDILDINNAKYRKLIGLDIRAEDMDRHVDKTLRYITRYLWDSWMLTESEVKRRETWKSLRKHSTMPMPTTGISIQP